MCLSLLNIPIILEHVVDTISECFFQFKCVSNVSPKKLNSSTFSIIVLLILGAGAIIYLLYVWKTMYSHLETFKESLLICNHSLILLSLLLKAN